MPFDYNGQGVPFPDEFADWRGDVAGGSTPEDVQWQVTQLAERRYQPAVRHELLRVLEQRREPRHEDRRDAGEHPVQFQYLPVDIGFDTLLVRGELLITADSLGGGRGRGWNGLTESAENYVTALGLRVAEVECPRLRDRVKRLVPDRHLSAQALADIAENLRLRGFAASLTNVTPLAPITKCPPGPGGGPGGPPPGSSGAAAPMAMVAQEQPQAAIEALAKVAVIDTGIADQEHPRTDYVLRDIGRDTENIDYLHRFPLEGSNQYLDFAAGHGTFVTGLVRQVAPASVVTVYRAIDSDGIGSEVAVACKMIQAVEEGNQIINLSLGCQTLDDFPPIAIQAALEIIREMDAAKEERDRTVIVAAAGNYAGTRPCWPAAFPGVVAVAGLNPNMTPAPWSSQGFWVTCSTIGQGLRSTYVYGSEDPLVDPAATTFAPPNPWAVWSGTSFAAPQIAGALARLRQDAGLGGQAGLEALLGAGVPIPGFGQAVQLLLGM